MEEGSRPRHQSQGEGSVPPKNNVWKEGLEGQHQLDQGQKVPKVNDETGERR